MKTINKHKNNKPFWNFTYNSSDDVSDGPSPRLCILHHWPDFQGYGFNLHSDKDKSGQFIGNVDADSPASDAGLKEGDHIVEVNGVNVLSESHGEVVGRVKSNPNTVSLLVVDRETEDYYKSRGITVHHDMSNVITGETRDKSEPVEVQVSTFAAVETAPESDHEEATPGKRGRC